MLGMCFHNAILGSSEGESLNGISNEDFVPESAEL
jgi:hypothetical protein